MSKRKILSLLLAIVMLATCMAAGQMSANADQISTDNSLMYQEYCKYFLQTNENYTPVFTGYKTLLDVDTDSPVAYVFEFNNGYIIIDISAMSVYEYSLSTPSPYIGLNTTEFYYNGPIAYYFKTGNEYIHTCAKPDDEGNYVYKIPVNEMSSVISGDADLTDMQKAEKLRHIENVYETNAAGIIAERSLSGTLSTAYIENYCGPTSAHAMLRYLGYTDRSVSTHDMIILISTYTGRGVTLSSLKNGINEYLIDKGYGTSVYSRSFSFSFVMSEINSGQPLTLGTSGGGLSSGNHVQTIHGYRQITDGNNNITYTLVVNDSWGNNNRSITYTNTVPSYLKDHVYF